jgi:hypothetical protein
VRDFTCNLTLAISLINRIALGRARVAEAHKAAKYSSLSSNYTFEPIAIETFGAESLEASAFIPDLGRRLHFATHEPWLNVFDATHQCVAVQRDDVACLIGSVPPCRLLTGTIFFICSSCVVFFITRPQQHLQEVDALCRSHGHNVHNLRSLLVVSVSFYSSDILH